MANTPTIRLSTRTRAPTQKLIASVLSARVEKRRSPRLARLNTVQIQVITQHVAVARTRFTLSGFIVNDTSSPAISEEEDEDEEEDDTDSIDASDISSVAGEENLPLSNDKLEYMAGDSLDRRNSYDSRLESGNEAYMLDDFVVGSEEEDSDWSEAESEITITRSVQNEEDGFEAESEAPVSRPRRSTRLDSAVSVSSTTSSGSESSGSFVTDGREEIPVEFPFDDYFFRPIESHIEPADVAEEITEAVIRFGRRCNRFTALMCLELTRIFSEDAEVVEAIQLAVDRGFCTFKQVSDEKMLCVIGTL